MRVVAILFALGLPLAAAASPYDPMIDFVATQHGIDPILLRAITQQESKKNPWTFNADGEGFHFADKRTAVSALWALTTAPWMAKISPEGSDGKIVRRFFSTSSAAQAFINGYQRSLIGQGKRPLLQRTDDKKEVDRGQARVRRLWLINTDIGIAQVNYRYHGQDIATVQTWFDPIFNLTYAARLIAKHKAKYGSDMAAAAHYHSGTAEYQKRYLSSLLPTYQKEKSLASTNIYSR